MIRVNYYLKTKDETDSIIVCKVSFDGKRAQVSTGEKINTSDWNKSNQRLFEREPKKMRKVLFNQSLTSWQNKIEDAYQAERESLTIQKMSNIIRGIIKGDYRSSISFFEYFPKYLDRLKGTGGYKSMNTTYNKMLLFRSSYGTFDWKDITVDWMRSFQKWHYDRQETSLNYISKQINNIKVYCRYAKDNGIHNEIGFDSRKFKIARESVNNIYLSMEELLSIYELDYSGNKNMEQTRDHFLISALTGLRYGDIQHIKPEMINNNILDIVTAKKNKRVIIPLHWIVQEIFEKYNYNIPKPYVNQVMNRKLKIIAQDALLVEKISKTKTVNGKLKTEVFEKWELVSFHTARRSMATNMHLAGLPDYFNMGVLGHSNLKTYQNYIKSRLETLAEEYREHDYFKK